MKLRDIKILQAGTMEVGPLLEENPSFQTKSFLIRIINDPYFQDKVNYLREEYIFHSLETLYDKRYVIDLFQEMKGEIRYIITRYNLSALYTWSFFLLIVFNAFEDITDEDLEDIFYLENCAE